MGPRTFNRIVGVIGVIGCPATSLTGSGRNRTAPAEIEKGTVNRGPTPQDMKTPMFLPAPNGLSPPIISASIIPDVPRGRETDDANSLPAILLIEESATYRHLTQELLRNSGLKNPVVSVRDVGQAIVWLEMGIRDFPLHSSPVAMFIDLELACDDGMPLIRWARSRRELDGMLIAVLSGSPDPELRKLAIAAGADRYLGKFPGAEIIANMVTAWADLRGSVRCDLFESSLRSE